MAGRDGAGCGHAAHCAEFRQGPLAGAPQVVAPVVAATEPVGDRRQIASRDEAARADDRRGTDGDPREDLHEAMANQTYVLVILHLRGVALAGIVHRENLARAMVTGMKRAED